MRGVLLPPRLDGTKLKSLVIERLLVKESVTYKVCLNEKNFNYCLAGIFIQVKVKLELRRSLKCKLNKIR